MTHKLAVVVPYRNRETHLRLFVPFMFNYLSNLGIDHRMLIVEQEDGKFFNRAKLMNIGFDLAKDDCDYFAFHDVDLLPEEGADYSYPTCPTHMSAYCSQFGYKIPYETIFGGVALFKKDDFLKVNGYSNEYWGWGGEDDDMYNRCQREEMGFVRRPNRYTSLEHERQILTKEEYSKNLQRLHDQRSDAPAHKEDGFTSLSYRLLSEDPVVFTARKYRVSL